MASLLDLLRIQVSRAGAAEHIDGVVSMEIDLHAPHFNGKLNSMHKHIVHRIRPKWKWKRKGERKRN